MFLMKKVLFGIIFGKKQLKSIIFQFKVIINNKLI